MLLSENDKMIQADFGLNPCFFNFTLLNILKEIIGFIRDAAIVYFIGERIADNKR